MKIKFLFPVFLLLASITTQAQFPVDIELPNEDMTTTERVIPSNSGAPKYAINWSKHPSAFSSAINYTVNQGWNCASGGGAVVSGVASLCAGFEHKFEQSSGVFFSEFVLRPTNIHGVTSNILTVQASHATTSNTIRLDSDNFNLVSNGGSVQVGMGVMIFNEGMKLRQVVPNAPFLQAMNHDSTAMINLLYLDGSSRAKFGAPVDSKDAVLINGTKVLGPPCPGILNSDGSLADTQRAVNELLGCLRTLGPVAN